MNSQLQEGKGVATGLGDDSAADLVIEATRDDRLEEHIGVQGAQPDQRQLRQAPELCVVLGTGREDHPDRLGM